MPNHIPTLVESITCPYYISFMLVESHKKALLQAINSFRRKARRCLNSIRCSAVRMRLHSQNSLKLSMYISTLFEFKQVNIESLIYCIKGHIQEQNEWQYTSQSIKINKSYQIAFFFKILNQQPKSAMLLMLLICLQRPSLLSILKHSKPNLLYGKYIQANYRMI